ncbi:hypothetical protein ACIPZ8_21540 [Pseudomonas sp. NPDC089422]|uniref:hypothetical protein n=1 Tax=Pseudomonas sp. NPDC089422 TaxID=3364466 RepID=UPI0037F80A3D
MTKQLIWHTHEHMSGDVKEGAIADVGGIPEKRIGRFPVLDAILDLKRPDTAGYQ